MIDKGFDNNIPAEPIVFSKTSNCLIGPDQPIVIPEFLKEYPFKQLRCDYEAELAFIVRDKCKNIPESEAMEHILGFTCMNDVSQRNFQHHDKSGWFRGKSLDTFGPVGPVIVPPDMIGDVNNLDICCRLNSKVVQSANTRDMIFSVAQILSTLSKWFTLYPGDLISTGTPAGIGPIKAGDTVEVGIQGIGTLLNPVQEG